MGNFLSELKEELWRFKGLFPDKSMSISSYPSSRGCPSTFYYILTGFGEER